MQNNVNTNNVNTNIKIWGTCYHKFGQNINILKIVYTKYMVSSEAWHHQLTFAYTSTGQEMFRENLRNLIVILPYFSTDYSSGAFMKMFTYIWIKLNLFWISPLKKAMYKL